MSNILISTVSVGVGLVIGNFIVQVVKDAPNYSVAFERSFFQIAALVTLLVVLYIQDSLQ